MFLLLQFVLVTKLNTEPFHLIGISMGGAIVGVYAALYPKDVALVTACCPASKVKDIYKCDF